MSNLWNSFVQGLSLEVGAGKYLALSLMGVFFLWLLGRYRKNKTTRELLLFEIALGVLVIFPLTAMLLMKYQTAFFGYRHLLLLLFPMIFIPWALTEAVEQGLNVMKRNAEEGELVKERPWVARMIGVFIAVCLLMLSGNMVSEGVETNFTLSKEKVPASVMEVLELIEDGEVLVAPNEVLEYARAYNGDIKLLYGRDMWQPELRAFTYNIYDETACEIYEWMQDETLNYFNVSQEELETMQKERDTRGFSAIAGTDCDALVLPHTVYERLWVYPGPEEMQGFEVLEETTLYVVLVRR